MTRRIVEDIRAEFAGLWRQRNWKDLLGQYNKLIYHTFEVDEVVEGYLLKAVILAFYLDLTEKAEAHIQKAESFQKDLTGAVEKLLPALRRRDQDAAAWLAERFPVSPPAVEDGRSSPGASPEQRVAEAAEAAAREALVAAQEALDAAQEALAVAELDVQAARVGVREAPDAAAEVAAYNANIAANEAAVAAQIRVAEAELAVAEASVAVEKARARVAEVTARAAAEAAADGGAAGESPVSVAAEDPLAPLRALADRELSSAERQTAAEALIGRRFALRYALEHVSWSSGIDLSEDLRRGRSAIGYVEELEIAVRYPESENERLREHRTGDVLQVTATVTGWAHLYQRLIFNADLDEG